MYNNPIEHIPYVTAAIYNANTLILDFQRFLNYGMYLKYNLMIYITMINKQISLPFKDELPLGTFIFLTACVTNNQIGELLP